MKKFYKVEAFRSGLECAVKHVFNVYSENEAAAKNMVYRHTRIRGYHVRIANIKEIEVIKLLGTACAKAKDKEAKDIIGYVASLLSLLSVSGCREVDE